MASGRIVKDVIGHRLTVVAKYDYVPNDLVVALNAALRKTPFLMVEYPAPGGTESGVYEIEPLSLTLFKFDRDSGLSVWHEVTLTMVSQEVYR
jgi:hypothetical protein